VAFSGITFARGGAEPEVSGFRAPALDGRLERLRVAAGPRLATLELSALVQRVIVTGDRRSAAAELARRWAALSEEDILASPFTLLGSPDEMAAQLVAHRARWGISYWVVFESAVAAFAPVVARLAGT
jgi:hypothetical protein